MTSNIKAYVASFRIRELQECLTQLQLPTKGRKAELQARLFAYLGEASPTEARGVEPPQERWKIESASESLVREALAFIVSQTHRKILYCRHQV